ncbi:TPA: hypothetical protein N0F65_002044 [Lagenidium giganteum]|uniref:Uncharacterized protein n=1 Tax=Lagenidium giganteum TaxID=4803 RepID=A0AAV2ZC01_9STRA|nr:TPA: hypothetical protein N0F65_002044 [Lagenidium giganteum]
MLWDADDTDDYVFQLMLELEREGVDIPRVRDDGWNTLLHLTAMWNRPAVMEELVRKGADLNVINKNGHTPLDLARHWGYADIALQISHYGGKHTCERERDIAISQRDLAQTKIRENEAELEEALLRLRKVKQEREELRIERDRMTLLYHEVVQELHALEENAAKLGREVAVLVEDKKLLQVRNAELVSELTCEQTARMNAVQSWKVTEKLFSDLQALQEEHKEREEQALRARNEAMQELEVARSISHQAQVDQGLSKQLQTAAETERDQAVERFIGLEKDIAVERDMWKRELLKAERERKNIQIEIDRQTLTLRTNLEQLEEHNTKLTVQFESQRQQLDDANARVAELSRIKATLEGERHEEHIKWRTTIERTLQNAIVADLRRVLETLLLLWRRVCVADDEINQACQVPPVEPTKSTSESSMLPSLRDPQPQRKLSMIGPETDEREVAIKLEMMKLGMSDENASYQELWGKAEERFRSVWNVTDIDSLLRADVIPSSEVVHHVSSMSTVVISFLESSTIFMIRQLKQLR